MPVVVHLTQFSRLGCWFPSLRSKYHLQHSVMKTATAVCIHLGLETEIYVNTKQW